MSTRSNIAILNNDGTVTAIYAHWDGYIDYNGRILSESYQEIEKVKKLISGGDLSSLYREIEPTAKHSFEMMFVYITTEIEKKNGNIQDHEHMKILHSYMKN